MALNFPNTPANGQAYVDPNGQKWVYETSTNSWTAEGTSGGMVYKGGIDITTAPPTGAQAGNVYSVTTGGTADAGFTGITGNIPAGTQVIFDGTNWQWVGKTEPPASETVAGIVELATDAETTTGTDNTRAVHPAGLKVELDKKLNLAGGTLTGPLVTAQVTSPEQTITAGAFDLATGPFWTCGAIAIPNPTNAVAGMSGLIRLTDAPTGWGTNFNTITAPTVFPSIVPFYVESATQIRIGPAVGVA